MKSERKVMRIIVLASIVVFGLPTVLSAKDVYWTGGGADNKWSTSGNWNGQTFSDGDIVYFDNKATNGFTQNLEANKYPDKIVVLDPGDHIALTNNKVWLNRTTCKGIDMSQAAKDLTFNYGWWDTGVMTQTWTVAANRTLRTSNTWLINNNRVLILDGAGMFCIGLPGGGSWLQLGGGNIIQSNGTSRLEASNQAYYIGHSAGKLSTFTLINGAIALTNSQSIQLGSVASGVGCLNLYGGKVTVPTLYAPAAIGATGTVMQSGGTLTMTTLNVGTVGTGTMTVTNASVVNLSGTATVGSGTVGTVGTLNLDGGTINFMTTSADLVKGANGTITANGVKFSNQTGTSAGVSTGSVTVSANMVLGLGGLTVMPAAGGSRSLNLIGNLAGNGGVTLAQGFSNTSYLSGSNSFAGNIVVNGSYFQNNSMNAIPVGTAMSLTNNAQWALTYDVTLGRLIGDGAIYRSGSVAMMTVGYGDVSSTFSGVIGVNTSTSIALNKIGSGTLALNGVFTHAGGTIVSNGILEVAGRIAPINATSVTVTSLGCLAGTGRVDRVVMQDGGRLMPGTAAACGTLTVSNLTLSASSVVVINAGTATNSTLNVTGTGTALSGTVRVESVDGKNTRKILGLNIPGGYTGTFSKVESASGNFSYVAVYGDKTVTLVPMIGTMIRFY